ncbi:MAG: hypothetical protein RLZZ338_2982 [Cyanobacteriota bacterium]|jgi:hypothetical protein
MFLIINQGSVTLGEQELSLKLMQNLVGVQGEQSYIEMVRNQFSDPNIDLVCDDSFLNNSDCVESCITPKAIILHGQVLAVGVNNSETVGLSPAQLEIVMRELLVFNKVDGILIGYPAMNFFN